jgi:hypothetical protein
MKLACYSGVNIQPITVRRASCMSSLEIAHTLVIKKPDSGQEITLKPGGLSFKKHPELFDSGKQTTLISTLIASRAEALGLCLQCNTLRGEVTSTNCGTCGEPVDFVNLFWCRTCFHVMLPQGSGMCSRCGSEKIEGPLWELAQQRLREDSDDSMDRYGYQYSELLLAAAPKPADVTSKQIDQAASGVSARQESPPEIMAALPVSPPPTEDPNHGADRATSYEKRYESILQDIARGKNPLPGLPPELPGFPRFEHTSITVGQKKGGLLSKGGPDAVDSLQLNLLMATGWEIVTVESRQDFTQYYLQRRHEHSCECSNCATWRQFRARLS